MSARPRLPLSLRALNGAGAGLRRLGIRTGALDAGRLMERARRATGLSDFGDDGFREPMRILIDSLEREAHLTLFGRLIARSDFTRLLENRLYMTETWRRHPEIGERGIHTPIFIVGLPRTGTTILHELMAQDPDNRVPMTWEVMRPWPPPERVRYESDARIEQAERHFSGVDRVLPGFKQMHPMGARLPQECVALMAHDFACMIHHTSHRVPSYQAWLEAADPVPIYRSHRRQLQYLQWRCPTDRWVLKSPGHLWALDALLTVYPDARIVQTHRDPLKVVASLTSLVTLLRGMASDRVDPREIGEDWTRRLAAGLEYTMNVRAQGSLPDDRVVDLQFQDFIRDELQAVRRIYQHFGLSLSSEAEDRMGRFLRENPRHKHGAHRYALRDAGLDVDTERRRFAAYQERFGVGSEDDV